MLDQPDTAHTPAPPLAGCLAPGKSPLWASVKEKGSRPATCRAVMRMKSILQAHPLCEPRHALLRDMGTSPPHAGGEEVGGWRPAGQGSRLDTHTPDTWTPAASPLTPVKPSTLVLGGSAHRGQEPSGRSACEERITGSVSEDQTPEGPPSLLVGFHALILVTADERLLLISTLLTASPTAPPSVASGFTQTHGCHGSGERWPRSRIRRRDAGRGPHCPRGSAEHWAEH